MISGEYALLLKRRMIFIVLKSLIIIEEEMSMNNYIEAPTMGEILKEEFMVPMNLSSYKLAHDIHAPVSRIQAILNSGRKITPDTSIRLARYFGVSDRYFLNLQNDLDIRELKTSLKSEISSIKPYSYSTV